MSNSLKITAFLCFSILYYACKKHNFTFDMLGNKYTSMIYEDGNEKVKLAYNGDFLINDKETAFESMSPNSKISFDKGDIEFSAKADDKGNISYFFDDEKMSYTEAEKSQLSLIMKELSALGVDAPSKCAKLYSTVGISGILQKYDELRSDNARSIFLNFIVEKGKPTSSEMILTLDKSKSLESDYNKANLLKKINASLLQDIDVTNSFIDAIGFIESDYDKSSALKYLIENNAVINQSSKLNEAISKIDADYDKKEVIMTLLKNKNFNAEGVRNIVSIMKTIDGDYEKSELLKNVANLSSIDESITASYIDVVNAIDADYNKSETLKTFATKNIKFNDENFARIMDATSQIDGNYEKAEVLKSYLENELDTDNKWLEILKVTATLDSSYDKETMLEKISIKMPKSATLIEAYKSIAKSIDDDAAYGRMMRKIQ